MRRSTWNSVISSSFSSKTLVPCTGSKFSRAVTAGSERGRMVKAQRAATPTPRPPRKNTITVANARARNHRLRRLRSQPSRFPDEDVTITLVLYRRESKDFHVLAARRSALARPHQRRLGPRRRRSPLRHPGAPRLHRLRPHRGQPPRGEPPGPRGAEPDPARGAPAHRAYRGRDGAHRRP